MYLRYLTDYYTHFFYFSKRISKQLPYLNFFTITQSMYRTYLPLFTSLVFIGKAQKAPGQRACKKLLAGSMILDQHN